MFTSYFLIFWCLVNFIQIIKNVMKNTKHDILKTSKTKWITFNYIQIYEDIWKKTNKSLLEYTLKRLMHWSSLPSYHISYWICPNLWRIYQDWLNNKQDVYHFFKIIKALTKPNGTQIPQTNLSKKISPTYLNKTKEIKPLLEYWFFN